jgi:gliding motility-associated-like protein
VIATNTTDSSTIGGLLNLNFGNICPTADSTAYAIRVVYGSCSNPAIEVSFTDTVFVKKTGLNATITKTDATCDNNGSITINTTSTIPLQYSINNGTNYYSTNVFTNLAPGTYAVSVNATTTSCPFTQNVTIALNGSISVNAGLDTTICAGASFTRTLVSTATSYVWTSSGGLNSPSVSPAAVLSPQATTTYTITAIRGNCTATDELLVNVIPGATVNAGQDASIFGGQSYTMQATASAGVYAWTPATGLSNAGILQPVATPQVTTTYTLQVTNSQGCISSDQIVITVIPYCIKPMEAFTPNGDGINDYWLITTGNCLKAAKAQVFNRYGAKVFESNDYHNDWKGTYNGKPLPDGTYYFMITYTLLNGKTEYKKGNVTILR